VIEAEGDDSLEVLDCATCDRDRATACPVCPLAIGYQPRLTGRVKWMLTLYRRMMAYGALPAAGGLLAQDEELMRAIDAIHEELGAAQQPGGGKIIEASGSFAHLNAG